MNGANDERSARDRVDTGAELDDWVLGDEPESLANLINHVLDRGVVAQGDVTISVAGVDLVYLGLSTLLTSISTAHRTLGSRPGLLRARGTMEAANERVPIPPPEVDRLRRPAATEGQEVSDPAAPAAPDPLAARIVELTSGLPDRLDIEPEAVQRDLARLVLTLVELLRRVVEHQAVRRMEDGDLSEAQIERMGVALQHLEEKLQEIKAVFGLADHELNIDLGPLGKLL